MKLRIAIIVAFATFAFVGVRGGAAEHSATLKMVPIDNEGGGGTLFVTPEGHSVLIDVGNPEASRLTGDHPSSERVLLAAQKLGIKKIDYLIVTHYHVDHIGALESLLARMPIGTFIDHGENREITGTQIAGGGSIGKIGRLVPPPGSLDPGAAGAGSTPPRKSTDDYYQDYLRLIKGHPHIVAKPGYTLSVDGMKITVIAADAEVIQKPLPGAGAKNAACQNMPEMPSNNGEENSRSIASIITYGRVRIAAFGDLTWDREKDLFCPNDKVGKVDVYLASHHGSYWSGSPAMLNALQPLVTVVGNSATKGNDPERVKTIQSSPRFEAMWQLHASRTDPQSNSTEDMIANPDLTTDGRYNLRLEIAKDGDITVVNERNNFSKSYKAGR